MKRIRLMATPSQFVLSRLSRTLYLEFLDKARRLGYAFLCFQDFLPARPPLPGRYIVLRHDVDFAPEYALAMAQLEYDDGITSTYHVLMDGQFYNPLESRIIRLIRQIHALGHEVGLHFSVSSSVEVDLGREVAFRIQLLSNILGTPVRSYSQHDPVNAGFATVVLPQGHYSCVDATRIIAENNLLYVSDSAMMWRRYTFATALDQGRNLCLLAHPHSWLHGQPDYIAMIREFEAQEIQDINDRYDTFIDALPGYYDRRLNEGA